jgi:hypothetical protein
MVRLPLARVLALVPMGVLSVLVLSHGIALLFCFRHVRLALDVSAFLPVVTSPTYRPSRSHLRLPMTKDTPEHVCLVTIYGHNPYTPK